MAIVKKEVKVKYYAVLKDLDPNEKCPPQCKLIVDTIKAAGGRVEREELLTLMKRPPAEGGLTTTQTAERILGFYRPKLAAAGVMKEETVAPAAAVEGAPVASILMEPRVDKAASE